MNTPTILSFSKHGTQPDCDRCKKHGRTCRWPQLALSRAMQAQTAENCLADPCLQSLGTLSKSVCSNNAIPPRIYPSANELIRGMNGQLLRYYADSAAHMAAVFDNDQNIFLTTFLQLAIQGLSQGSTALLYSILSYAASHYAQRTPSFSPVALELHGKAISATSEAIRHLNEQRDDILQRPGQYEDLYQYNLAATLMLCSIEITRGETSTWLVHHQGTKSLLQLRAHGTPPPEHNQMLRMFAYHDCLSLTTDPIFDQELWQDVLNNAEVPLQASKPDYDCLMGAAARVFYYINCLRRLECESNAQTSIAIVNQIIGIVRGLQSRRLSCDSPPEYIKVAETYRMAAQIQLHRIACRWQYVVLTDDELVTLSESIVDACSEVPRASILWPLAMAAPFVGLERQGLIRQYIERGHIKHGLAHFEKARYVFEALWAARSQGNDVSFGDILRAHNWSLSLT